MTNISTLIRSSSVSVTSWNYSYKNYFREILYTFDYW